MTAPRILIAIGPSMYAEALAFSVRKHRPRVEVSLLDPSEDLEAEARRARPHLIVANWVPRAARSGCFWVEVVEPVGGEGPRPSARRSRPTGIQGALPTSAPSTCWRRSTGPKRSSSSGSATPKAEGD